MTRPSQPHAQPKIHEDQHPPLANTRTVAQARATLAEHEARCPGSPLECFGHPELEQARQTWVDAKALLLHDLELAERMDAATWRDLPLENLEPLMPAKKTDQEKLNTMLTRLERLIALDERRQASSLRSQIRSHCIGSGIPVPALPVNPNPTPGIIAKAMPKATTPEAILPPQPKGEAVACAQLEHALGLPKGAVSSAAEAATYRPDMRAEVREIIAAGTQEAMARRAQWLLVDAAQLLKEAALADGAARAEATPVLGNLDALVHMVHLFVAEGRIEVSA